jgi:hypothetical protein
MSNAAYKIAHPPKRFEVSKADAQFFGAQFSLLPYYWPNHENERPQRIKKFKAEMLRISELQAFHYQPAAKAAKNILKDFAGFLKWQNSLECDHNHSLSKWSN